MSRNGRLVDAVYSAVKDDICMGTLEPGSRVQLADICGAHGVSLSVVREAMTRLAAENLVQSRPQQGYWVWPLSVPDLVDLTRVRVEIESLCLGDSIRDGDLTWESNLVAAHHRLLGTMRPPGEPASRPDHAWMRAHDDFHEALAAACGSPRLRRLRRRLFHEAELYRHWSVALGNGRNRDVAGEHRALLDAALARDAGKAVELIGAHLRRTADLLLEGRADGVRRPPGEPAAPGGA